MKTPKPFLLKGFAPVIGNHYRTIIASFLIWKSLLTLISLNTPSPAYDTSTAILLGSTDLAEAPVKQWLNVQHITQELVLRLVDRLTRWDSIYFTKIAQRGYVNEQEWAFGWGYSQAIRMACKLFEVIIPSTKIAGPHMQALSGIFISNTCHLSSVFVLYELTLISSTTDNCAKNYALITSLLHVITPAGIFMSSTYSESLFSLLNFTGYYLYVLSMKKKELLHHIDSFLLIILSSLVFSFGCTVRSNGALNGVLFLADFLSELWQFQLDHTLCVLLRVIAFGIGGLIIGVGTIFPQFIAWRQFCTTDAFNYRPWCSKSLPSIYLWVQDHYWDVGVLRYWKFANLPLFLLALPTLSALTFSGLWGLRLSITPYPGRPSNFQNTVSSSITGRLALPQMLLALLAIISYHVQIITRLSSGYVLLYWWLANSITQEGNGNFDRNSKLAGILGIRWMVVYAVLQAVLFAGFLPPA